MTSPLLRFLYDTSTFSMAALGIGIIEGTLHKDTLIENCILLGNCQLPRSVIFWLEIAILLFLAVAIIYTSWFLKKYSKENRECVITIDAKTVKPFRLEGSWQLIAAISPWISIFWHANSNWYVIGCFCVSIIIFAFTRIHHHYNPLCRLFGYKQYEVGDGQNEYLLLSKKTIKNISQIKRFNEIDEYTGIII